MAVTDCESFRQAIVDWLLCIGLQDILTAVVAKITGHGGHREDRPSWASRIAATLPRPDETGPRALTGRRRGSGWRNRDDDSDLSSDYGQRTPSPSTRRGRPDRSRPASPGPAEAETIEARTWAAGATAMTKTAPPARWLAATTRTAQRLAGTVRTTGTTVALVGDSKTPETIGTAGTTKPTTPAADATLAKTVTDAKTALTARTGGSGTGAPAETAGSRRMTATACVAAPWTASQGRHRSQRPLRRGAGPHRPRGFLVPATIEPEYPSTYPRPQCARSRSSGP